MVAAHIERSLLGPREIDVTDTEASVAKLCVERSERFVGHVLEDQ
jgi:hypothetical protein